MMIKMKRFMLAITSLPLFLFFVYLAVPSIVREAENKTAIQELKSKRLLTQLN